MSLQNLQNLHSELIIQILSFVHNLDIRNIKPNIDYLNDVKFNHNNKNEHVLLKQQIKNMINLLQVCKYFNNIINLHGFKI